MMDYKANEKELSATEIEKRTEIYTKSVKRELQSQDTKQFPIPAYPATNTANTASPFSFSTIPAQPVFKFESLPIVKEPISPNHSSQVQPNGPLLDTGGISQLRGLMCGVPSPKWLFDPIISSPTSTKPTSIFKSMKSVVNHPPTKKRLELEDEIRSLIDDMNGLHREKEDLQSSTSGELLESLKQIDTNFTDNPFCVGFIGDHVAKSALLHSLLVETEDTIVMTDITTEFWFQRHQIPRYEVKVTFIPQRKWVQQVLLVQSNLRPEESEEKWKSPTDPLIKALQEKLKKMNGEICRQQRFIDSRPLSLLPEQAQAILQSGDPQIICGATIREVRKQLSKLYFFSPIIQNIQWSGPWEILKSLNACFVSFPTPNGDLSDPFPTLSKKDTPQQINCCDRLFLVPKEPGKETQISVDKELEIVCINAKELQDTTPQALSYESLIESIHSTLVERIERPFVLWLVELNTQREVDHQHWEEFIESFYSKSIQFHREKYTNLASRLMIIIKCQTN